MSNIFLYPELPEDQKVQMEKSILDRPFEYSPVEVQHLLANSFPFARLDRVWLEHYCDLADSMAGKSHLGIPGDLFLRRWATHQRQLWRNGKLLPNRQCALNRIGFKWTPGEDDWQERYDAYREYADGKSDVLSRSLRSWASVQRERWYYLSEPQRKLLLRAGVSPDPFKKSRARNLIEMESHFHRKGNLVGLPIRLAKFSESVRRFHASGKLDIADKVRLDRLNFKWVIPRRTVDPSILWEQLYAQVAAYLKPMLPHVPPLPNWDNPRLAQWTTWHRQTKRWQRLTPEQKQKLAALNLAPGTVQRLNWDAHYDRAIAIHQKMKPSSIGAYKRINKTVYRWLTGQKERWRNLNPDQRRKLLELGMDVPSPAVQARLKVIRRTDQSSEFSPLDERVGA